MPLAPELRAAATLAVTIALCVPAARADVVETRALEETIEVADPTGLEVVVDNVYGSVRVTAHDRNVVEMSANETIRGDTQADVERGRSEMGLRTVREDGRVAFLVRRLDGSRAGECGCGWFDDYVIAYDIELRVPRDVAIAVETVNGGEITVEGVRGRFDVANVNGAVTLRGLASAGRAKTVNGRLTAEFERAPIDDSAFETVNGKIEVSLPAGLSADLAFQTMRGDLWTDFEAAPLPSELVTEERPGGGVRVRAERRTRVRVGAGGPTLDFETLNGDIYVRRSN